MTDTGFPDQQNHVIAEPTKKNAKKTAKLKM